MMSDLTPEQAQEAMVSGLKAAGIEGIFGVIKKADGSYQIINFGVNAIEEAGIVKFLQTSVEVGFVGLLRPKKKQDTPSLDQQDQAQPTAQP